jgi:3'-phosphoadenosine 5'-phosphosulfate sulfotransferase (PAPS reductase)/FAD synthetase
MHILIGNYGNETIALLQWAIEQTLHPCYIVSVDTHWGAQDWQARVEQAQQYASQHGLQVQRLTAKQGFAQWVTHKREFPTKKFQWCAGLLKGLPLAVWLDEIDPGCEATVVMGKLRTSARAHRHLPSMIEESEHFGDRRVWLPLLDLAIAERDALIRRTGIPILPHRSLECDPCIHATAYDLANLAPTDVDKTAALEATVGQPMFAGKEIREQIICTRQQANEATVGSAESFTMGCGSPWACGE